MTRDNRCEKFPADAADVAILEYNKWTNLIKWIRAQHIPIKINKNIQCD